MAAPITPAPMMTASAFLDMASARAVVCGLMYQSSAWPVNRGPGRGGRMSAQPGTGTGNTSELLADRAYAALRDRIVQLRIPPGAPINEDELGRELDMGRTPVREAIKRLALENLATVFPRRGTFASEINITDLAHIADVRQQAGGHAAYR